jgi:17beta-estradiol 17-dehydrogenase / very-long-chain 3-oxoacyl-CoA reductase
MNVIMDLMTTEEGTFTFLAKVAIFIGAL